MAPRKEVVQRAEPRELALLAQGRALIAESRSVDDLKKIRDKAEAIRAYFRQQKESLELQNEAAEIKLRAERRAGELLAEMPKRTNQNGASNSVLPALEDVGISRMESSRWQQEASLPEEDFEEWVSETREAGEELTSAGLRRIAKAALADDDDGEPGQALTSRQATIKLLGILNRTLAWWPEGEQVHLGKCLIAWGQEMEETGRFPE